MMHVGNTSRLCAEIHETTYMSRYAVKQKQTNLHTNQGNNRGFQEATWCHVTHVSNMLETHGNMKKTQKEIDCMDRIIDLLIGVIARQTIGYAVLKQNEASE
eukprot:1141996_1